MSKEVIPAKTYIKEALIKCCKLTKLTKQHDNLQEHRKKKSHLYFL
jgi:hypothetical protein